MFKIAKRQLTNRFIFFYLIAAWLFFCVEAANAREKLLFSIDLIRHGDRTPLAEIPKSPHVWKEGLGELTEEGKKESQSLGIKLHQTYMHETQLLPEIYDNKTIYVRSTDTDRTIKTAKYFLLGLYPLSKRATQMIPVDKKTLAEDDLLAVKPSHNLFSIIKMYVLSRQSWGDKVSVMQTELKHWRMETGMRIKTWQELGALADNLYIRELHHVPLPSGITHQDAAKIIDLSMWSIINSFKQKEVTYATSHHFLQAINQYFNEVSQHKTPLKYILFSGHDGTILSIMNALHHPLEEVPGYMSRLNFSLYENDENHYFVKITYNDKVLSIKPCAAEVCTLEQFTALVQ